MENLSNEQKSLRKYFKEIMVELFDYGTPIHYVVQISSAKTILQEIYDYYQSNKNSANLKQDHLSKLLEEFISLSKKDILFERYQKTLIHFNNFINQNFNKNEKNDKSFENNVELLILKIEPIIQILNETYFNNAHQFIETLLTKKDVKPGDFKKIKKTCFSLSTEILRRGYSRSFVYKSILDNFPIEHLYEESFSKRFNIFLGLFDQKEKELSVYLKILTNNADVYKLFKEKYGIANIDFIKPYNDKLVDFINIPKDKYSIFISKNIYALDPEYAIQIFTKEIYDFLDIVNYEYPKHEINVFKYTYCSGARLTVPNLEGHPQKCSIDFFNKKNQQIQKILESDYIEHSSKQKIKTLLKFYRYYCDANISEHKLLNLWIGWEHVFSFGFFRHSHTWSNVCKFFPKIHSLWYMNKIFSDIIYVQFHRGGNNVADVDQLISDNPKFKIPNLYSILKIGGEKWEKLIKLKFLNEDDLTKVKLYRLREKTKNPKKFIKEHEAKIEWELFRMYRVRNTIVHKGNVRELGLPIEVLTFRLELFYKDLLEIILDNLSYGNRYKNIEQLFLSLENTYDRLVSDNNHISKINDPKEIRSEIIKPSILF